MNYPQRINELLELCQDGWVSLQQCEKQQKLQPTSSKTANNTELHQAIESLHLAIKRLVQLQDCLDENQAVVNDPVWAENTDAVMEQVRTQLQQALGTATISASSPSSAHLDYHRIIGATATHSTPILITTTTSTTSSSSTLSSPSLILDKSVSSASSVSSSIINTSIPEEDHHDERTFGRRTITVEDWPPVQPDSSTRRLRILPLFKGLHSTRSTPLPGAPANINFFNEEEQPRKELFACDAIVNQPLRIGHGYGSYICYNCTVMSDKGPPISVRKRYSEFVDLREELVKRYPRLKSSIPKLPPKKVVGKFTPAFVEQRRRDLEYFFKYTVLHPTLGASPLVMNWIAP